MTQKKQIDIRAIVIAARDARGWTNYRLAKEAHLSPQNVARWLDDSTAYYRPHVTTETLSPILSALGLKIISITKTRRTTKKKPELEK